MNVIHIIALKECKASFRNGSFKVVGILMFTFLLITIPIGTVSYRHASKEKNDASLKVREQWLNQGAKNPHAAGHYGMITFKPIQPLSILEKGMINYFGQYIYLETHKKNDAEMKPAKDATSLLRFGEFTTAFLFQFIAPLFVILLCYSSVSSEREINTLRLVLSQNISLFKFITGKCLGNIYKVLLILFPLLTITSATIILITGIGLYPLLAHATMCFFYFIYLLLFIFISIGVSALSASSKHALLTLFFFWIFAGVFIPRFSSSLSENIYPTPSSFDLKTNFEASQGNKYVYGYKGFADFSTTYNKIEQRLMKTYQVTTADSLPVEVFGFAIEETEEEAQQLFEIAYGDVISQFQNQNRLHRYTAFFSPLAAIRFLSMGLSHTDLEEQINFDIQSEAYRRRIMKTLNMDIAYNSKKLNNVGKKRDKYECDKALWEKVPDFNYSPLPFHAILSNHLQDMLILSLWLIAVVLFVSFSVKKMDNI